MLKHIGAVRVYCQNFLRSTTTTTAAVCVEGRNYSNSKSLQPGIDVARRKSERFWKLTNAKKLQPLEVSVTSSRPLKRRPVDEFPSKLFDKDSQRYDPRFERDVRNMDLEMEPNLEELDSEFGEHSKETFHRRNMTRRQKMTRKHFKEFIPQEVSVLTWAEKENIKFLHKTNPDEWTPEALAESFPITVLGVEKLLKSKFQCHTKEHIVQHDKKIQRKIDLIRNGTIELTPELREKMKIREKIPFQIGMLPSNASELAFVESPKPLGEFARLVASKERIREVEEKVAEASRQQLTEKNQSKQINKVYLKEMERLTINREDKMTLSEFEEKLKSSPSIQMNSNPEFHSTQDSGTALKQSNPEVKYLLNMKRAEKPEPAPEIFEETNSNSSKNAPTAEDFLISYIPKFKDKNSQGYPDNNNHNPSRPSLKLENGEAYIFDHKTGYEKPYAPISTAVEDRINIPLQKRVPGGTYQVGNSFYDEDGEFLYRVI